MGNLMLAELTAPSGLWVIILNWIQSGVANFAWTIILFTLLVKVCLSPLDFFIKWSTKKSTLVQQKCAPQVAKLQKKYANNNQALQMQTQALYKKEGYNIGASCVVMLVNLVVTLLVFLSIFTSLKEVSAYQAIKQYQALDNAYTTTYSQIYGVEFTKRVNELFAEDNLGSYDPTFDYAGDGNELATENITQAQTYANEIASNSNAVKDAVKNTWEQEKESWAWITNIWVTDGKANPLPTYAGLKNLATSAKGLFGSKVNNEYVAVVESINETHYNTVTQIIHDQSNGWNGYYILAILAGVVTFLSSYITELGNKLKRKKQNKEQEIVVKKNQFIKTPETEKPANPTQQMGGTMKFMKILMPIMMIIFVLSSSAAFGIYVVTQSLISIGLGALINLIVNKITYKKQLEVLQYLDKIEGKKKK